MIRAHLVCIAFSLILLGAACSTRPDDPTLASVPEPTPLPTAAPTATPVYTPVFESAECQFSTPSDSEVECGYLIVPEDRSNPERMIRLHVAIVSSQRSDAEPDPVVYLEGGPGGSALANFEWLIRTFSDLLENRDLILFDQRGVGYSEPSLDCPEIVEASLANLESNLNDDEWLQIDSDARQVCHNRLIAEGIDLSAYNSAASAADLDDLRRALGYDAWNLLGISYGTRLALTAMRDFGENGTIRSVILDSVFPPQINGISDGIVGIDSAFDLLFERCANNESCNAAYPDLETRFYKLVDDLNEEPMTVPIANRINLKSYRTPFTGDDLISTVMGMMYSHSLIINIPKMLTQIEQGYSSILVNFLADSTVVNASVSEGMATSVTCVEEIPFLKQVDLDAVSENLPVQLVIVAEKAMTLELASCAVWDVDSAESIENKPVVSDVHTLILAGDYDPVTPPAYAQAAAETLENAYTFIFEGIGHGVTISTRCGAEMAKAFVDTPDTAPDADCMDRLIFGFVTQ